MWKCQDLAGKTIIHPSRKDIERTAEFEWANKIERQLAGIKDAASEPVIRTAIPQF